MKTLLAMAVVGLLASTPAYADTVIPFSGSFFGVNSGGSGGSFTNFAGPGLSASIQMIDAIGFNATSFVSPGQTAPYFLALLAGLPQQLGRPVLAK